MGNRRKAIVALLVVILLITLVIGIELYYNSEIVQPNDKTPNTQNQNSQPSSEMSNVTTQKTEDFASSNITVGLGVEEDGTHLGLNEAFPVGWYYNSIYIHGWAENTGDDTAVNVGLHVLAKSANNTVLVDMIVPLIEKYYQGGSYGTTPKINELLHAPPNGKVIQLSTLGGGEMTRDIQTTIYHEGVATNWTVTPVWTNFQIADQTPANIVVLNPVIVDKPKFGNPDYPAAYTHYNGLLIECQLKNIGQRTAYNASIRVVAYNASNSLLFNMSVGPYFYAGDADKINSLLDNLSDTVNYVIYPYIVYPPLYGEEAIDAHIAIFHEDTITNWTITPIWSNKDPSDNAPPQITVSSPENKTYYTKDLSLNFSINEPVSKVSYKLDNGTETEILGNVTMTGLSFGLHNLTLSTVDYADNMQTLAIHFTIAEEPERELFPAVPVAVVSVAVAVAVAAGLLVYLKKHKRKDLLAAN